MSQMTQIETEKSIRFENVISFRKKMRATDINKEVGEFINLLQRSGVTLKSPLISATFGIELIENVQFVDTEFLVAVNKEIEVPSGYEFKKIFHLVHAVYTRHTGDVSNIQSTYDRIVNFINQNKLQQITVAYNVQINSEKIILGEEPIIDIYIGINPSLL